MLLASLFGVVMGLILGLTGAGGGIRQERDIHGVLLGLRGLSVTLGPERALPGS